MPNITPGQLNNILKALPNIKLNDKQLGDFAQLYAKWPTMEEYICLNLEDKSLRKRLNTATRRKNLKLSGTAWSHFGAVCRHYGVLDEQSHSIIRKLWLQKQITQNAARLQREGIKNGNF